MKYSLWHCMHVYVSAITSDVGSRVHTRWWDVSHTQKIRWSCPLSRPVNLKGLPQDLLVSVESIRVSTSSTLRVRFCVSQTLFHKLWCCGLLHTMCSILSTAQRQKKLLCLCKSLFSNCLLHLAWSARKVLLVLLSVWMSRTVLWKPDVYFLLCVTYYIHFGFVTLVIVCIALDNYFMKV